MTRRITREEAIAYGKRVVDLGLNDKTQAFCELAIKALEQELILDKIIAEIEQYQSDYDEHGAEYDRTAWKAFNRCLQIIDKYKGESEET